MAQNSARRSRENGEKGKKEKNSNMKVVVRVRPPNSMEVSKQSSTSVRVMDERVLVFDPKDDSIDYLHGDRRRRQPGFLTRRSRDLRFMFDRVFDNGATNTDVFEHTTKAIVDGVLSGYNCTVFAYGATGAGKTFTMLGDSTNPGVMFLTMMELYSRINACKDEKSSNVAVSYLEVYNETIRDLLMPGQPLAVREDPQRGVCVSGLTLHKPTSAEELLGMLEFGNNNRTQHPTDANAQSSRSHAVFQVFVRQKDRTAGLTANFTMGKMSLIDLAGSERAIVTANRGARFREGANINKSLLALGNCINALADKENKAGHIPYRDSKLTRLLKDSLGGNCQTVMIAAVSPSGLSYEDTYNTLKYADRAMNITCKVVKNELSVDMHVSRYAKIVEELRIEISELKKKLFGFESGPTVPKKAGDSSAQTQEETQRLSSSLKCVMKERMVVRRNIIDIEAADKDLQIKLYRKERTLSRMQMVCVEGEKLEQARSKTQSYTDATKCKQKFLASKKADFEGQLAKNDTWLQRIHSEIKLETDPEAQSQLEHCQLEGQLQLENMELKRKCQLYKKNVQAQEKDAQNTERLVSKLLSMVQKQFFLLKGVGLATQDLTEEYNTVIEIVKNGREVTWADQSVKDNDIGDRSFTLSFQSTSSVGTPQVRTPIRKRQFNTPVADTDMKTPCRGASIRKEAMRTFTLSATSITCNNKPSIQTTENSDFLNPCVSLTKEFEAISPPAKAPLPTTQRCTEQKPLTPAVTTAGWPIEKMVTPLRVPASFTVSDNNTTLSSATFQCHNNLNNSSKCTLRKSTPHPKACWADKPADKPVEPDCTPAKQAKSRCSNATPLRNLNISGILPLRATPADREQRKMSITQIRRPPMNDSLSTPLRERPVNKQTGLKDQPMTDPLSTPLREQPVNKRTGLKDQLPSILNQLSNPFSKDKSKSYKQSKDMMPKRVCSATKENRQLSKPLRSSSILDLDKQHSKKIKKHINGLRRAVSTTNLATSRNFAPRSSPKRSNPECSWPTTDRPRWQ